jgi:hypothetical protein
LEGPDLDGNICILKRTVTWGLDLIYLAEDREQWWSLVNMHVPRKVRNLLSNSVSISFSRTLQHGRGWLVSHVLAGVLILTLTGGKMAKF